MAKKAKTKKKGRFAGKMKKAIERKAAKRGNYGYLQLPKGISIFKEEEGKVALDIIPYIVSAKNHPQKEDGAVKGEQWWCLPFKIHRNIGADNEKVVCPTSYGQKCPICEYRAKLLKKGTASKEDTDALRPSDRVLYNIIPKGHKKLDEVPHIWDISEYAFQQLLDTEVSEKEKYEDFADLEVGYTLEIRFEEKKVGKGAFASANRIDFEERDEQYDESILKKVADLDKVLKLLSYEELETKFLEMDPADQADDDDDIEDEDEDDTPKKKRKKKAAPVEEDEDDEDEDDEDDEDEDDEDEDDEDEDDEEDEDEDDDDDDDDEDEDDDDEDEDEEDDDDEDEEPEPPKKKKPAAKVSKKAPAKKPLKKRK